MAEQRLFNHDQKNRPVHTLSYEIEMWRRSYNAIKPTKEALIKTKSDSDLYEHNLRIEGFLLHTRNLLAFFTDQHNRDTDLTISRPNTNLGDWADENVDPQILRAFIDRARAVDVAHHGPAEADTCYNEISRYLSHCTNLRHRMFKDWDADAIFSDLDKIVSDFEGKFIKPSRASDAEAQVTRTLGASNSTASFRRQTD